MSRRLSKDPDITETTRAELLRTAAERSDTDIFGYEGNQDAVTAPIPKTLAEVLSSLYLQNLPSPVRK